MDYNAQDLSGIPADDAMVQLELKRKLAMADALRNQEAPQGQMVSGHYVAPSWTQALAGLAGKYVAGQQEQNAMKEYGQYQKTKQQKQAEALSQVAKRLSPQAITEQGSYNIQVPNGPMPTSMDNLGGMQPTGNKTISVPMTTTTGYKSPEQSDVLSALSDYAIATNQPDLTEKLMLNRATSLMTPDKFNIHNIGDTGFVINERTGLPKLDANGQPIKYEGQQKPKNIQYEKVREGTQEVTYQVNPDGTRVKIASGSAFAPEKPQPDPWHFNDKPSAPITNFKGWVLHTDASGNKAYVSPDGKSFEEAK